MVALKNVETPYKKDMVSYCARLAKESLIILRVLRISLNDLHLITLLGADVPLFKSWLFWWQALQNVVERQKDKATSG